MNKFIDFFVPLNLSNKDRNKARSLITIALIQIIAGIVFAPIYFFVGYTLAAIFITLGALSVFSIIFLIRYNFNIKNLRNFPALIMYVAVVSLNVIQGGFEAPTTMWLITVPVLAIFTGSILLGVYWGIISSLTVLVFYFSPFFGITYIPTPLDPETVSLLYALGTSGLILYISGFALANEIIKQKNLKEIHKLAGEDPLTRLFTRRRFFEKVKSLLAKENPLSLALLMIDIDRFKEINDNYGHHIGDMILEDFGNVCRDSMRTQDLCARFGGEEFVMMLPDISADEALVIAQKLRKDIASKDFTKEGASYKITISIGLKHEEYVNSLQTFDAMLIYADKAVYNAKKQGRNKVCTS
ncbi:MAG: GGDEF domain-containing protein [Thiovulaceae bacterium]|nr:GGDEF domain-containing protein [Sulfurimonadaceae bacterium]